MPSRSPLYLLLLAAVFAALIAWLTVTVQSAGRAAIEFPSEPEGSLVEVALPSSQPAAVVAADAKVVHLRIELTPTARLVPEAGAPFPVRIRDGEREIAPKVEALAGAWAGVRRSEAAGRSLLRIELADGTRLLRVVQHGPLTTGLEPVELTPGVVVPGIVRDERGLAIADAKVVCDGVEARSDAEGRFALTLPRGGRGVPLVVRADGKASHWQALEIVRSPERPVEITLAESAPVRVRVAGPARAGEGRVVVMPGGEMDTRLLRYPFWMQALEPTPLGEDGSALLAGVPKGSKVRIAVLHPGWHVREGVEVRVGTSSDAVLVRAVAAPTLRGVVRDAKGNPLAGALVASRRADGDLPAQSAAWLLPSDAGALDVTCATTDAEGRFALARRHDGKKTSLVRVVAARHFGIEVELAESRADVEHDFALAAAGTTQDGEPALALGLAARGRRVECTLVERGRTQRSWTTTDSEAVAIPLREACVVDLRTALDGAATSSRHWQGLCVVGRTAVSLDEP